MKKISILAIASILIFSSFSLLKISPQLAWEQTYNKLDSLVRNVNPVADTRPLSPTESLKAFKVPSGYHMELVAAEPMIQEPVAIAWDGNARMYVCEMRTYMQDADAKGEYDPTSRIMRLDDTDGDGRMDKSTVFIDSLALPRMILCINHELIVNLTDTYNMYSYTDTNNDGRADKKRLVYTVKQPATGNLEHQRSGLDYNLDNYIYMTVDPVRLKYKKGKMIADSLHSGSNGQWGLTHDNYGRLYFSRGGGENAGSGFQINPKYGALEFADAYNEADFGPVWSIISNSDAQGGLRRLRADSTLNHFTAGCGQVIYRGNKLPADLHGDYLIAEPVARIIRRAHVVNNQGKTQLVNAYKQQEFIASTDFYFRPTNLYTGPDGNLYIVDMSRGIVQESQWVPRGSWIRNQIYRMGLENIKQRGRIWRLVADGATPEARPNMLNETPAQLIKHLGHPNGWWRDNAQKQLVALGNKSIVPALKKLINDPKSNEMAVIHAIWTLDGLDALDTATLHTALANNNPQINRTAVWAAEPQVRKGNTALIQQIAKHKASPNHELRSQVLLTLSQSKTPQAQQHVKDLLLANADNPVYAAIEGSIKKNEDFRKFGTKLGRLSEEDRRSVIKGSEIFKSFCSSCHGVDGKGLASKVAPPIVDSKHLADKDMLLRILLNGLSGPIEGKEYPTIMPPLNENDDDYITSVANYIRFEFGFAPPPVFRNPDPKAPPMVFTTEAERAKLQNRKDQGNFTANFRRPLPLLKTDDITKLRAQYGHRKEPWTIAEIEQKTEVKP
jgi:glucose/arabinose dehydrogenase/mono/diheme cytochrome c family protein